MEPNRSLLGIPAVCLIIFSLSPIVSTHAGDQSTSPSGDFSLKDAIWADGTTGSGTETFAAGNNAYIRYTGNIWASMYAGGDATLGGLTLTAPGGTLFFRVANSGDVGSLNLANNAVINIASGVTLDIDSSWVNINLNDSLTKSGAGTLTIEEAEWSQGQLHGTLNIQDGTLQIAGGRGRATSLRTDSQTLFSLTGANSQLLLSGTTNYIIGSLSGDTGTVTTDTSGKTLTIAGTQDAVYGGTIRDNGIDQLTLVIDQGGRQILSGNNSYSGGTLIKQGRLDVLNSQSLGSGDVIVNDGGQLWLENTTYANNLTISGTGINSSDNGALRLTNATLTGNLVLAGDSRISTIFSSGTIQGNISGAYTLTIGSDYTSGDRLMFKGNVAVSGLQVGVSGASNVTIGDGGNLGSTNVQLNNNSSLNFNNSTGTTYSGAVSGSGLVNINGGTLLLNGSVGNGVNVSVGTGATLGGSGVISGNLQFQGGSILSVIGSNSDSSILQVGSVIIDSTAILNIDMSSFSLIEGTNSVTILNSSDFTGIFSQSLIHLNNLNSGFVLDGSSIQFNNGVITFDVSVIPEPGTWLLLGLGLALIAIPCWQQRHKA